MSIWTLDSINLTNIWYYPVCSLRLPKQMAVGPFERDRGIITMRVCIVLQEPFSWGHSEFFSQLVWAWQLAQVQKLGKWLQLFLLSTSWSSIFDFFFFWLYRLSSTLLSCPYILPLWAPHPINHLYSSLWVRPYRLTFQSCCCVHFNGYLLLPDFYYLGGLIIPSAIKWSEISYYQLWPKKDSHYSVSQWCWCLSGSTFLIALVTECPLGLLEGYNQLVAFLVRVCALAF